ncbi:MAG: vWA domain-containing protein [Candidatus Nanopelagicales bacterium]
MQNNTFNLNTPAFAAIQATGVAGHPAWPKGPAGVPVWPKGPAAPFKDLDPANAQPAATNLLPAQITKILDTPLLAFQLPKKSKRKAKGKPVTHIGFVLDKSGSMQVGKSATIEGFNTQIALVKNNAKFIGNTRITLVDFSDNARACYVARVPDEATELTEQNYIPNGMTALYDAIGLLIAELLLQPAIDKENTATLVTIFTDGAENVSKTYTGAMLKDIIQKLEATGRWTFALIGPTGGVQQLSNILAIHSSNVTGFNPASVSERTAVMGQMASANATYLTSRSSGATQVYGLYSDK